MGSSRVLVAALGVSLLSGAAACEGRRFSAALGRDTEDAWHAFLARYPEGSRARDARARLDAKRFADAQAADSIYGWRRYLADYPDGRFVAMARRRVGALRLERARLANDLWALRRTVDSTGDPEIAAQARTLLAVGELRVALARGDASALRAFLEEFPAEPGAAEARARLRTVELLAAGDDLGALERITTSYPGSAESATAVERLERLEAERVRAAGDDAEPALARFRARFPRSPALHDLERAVAAAALACAEGRLDAAAVTAWLAAHPKDPAAAAAGVRLRRWRGRAAVGARVRPLLDAALPYRPAASLDELRGQALGADLESARAAAAEIGLLRTPAAAGVLLDLATGTQLVVAIEAADALGRLCPGDRALCRNLLAGAHRPRPGEASGLRAALLHVAAGDESGALQTLTAASVASEPAAGRALPAVVAARLTLKLADPEAGRLALDQALASVEAHGAALERLFPVELDREHQADGLLAARTVAALGRLWEPLAASGERAAALKARLEALKTTWEERLKAAMTGFAPSAADPLHGRAQAHEQARAAALAALADVARREPLCRPALALARATRPMITRCAAPPAAPPSSR